MLKILQARLQQYVNCELPDVQAGFRKGRGTRDQIANIRWIIEKTREFQKNIYFCYIDYAKASDCVDHNKLWKILIGWFLGNHTSYIAASFWEAGIKLPGQLVAKPRTGTSSRPKRFCILYSTAKAIKGTVQIQEGRGIATSPLESSNVTW